MSNEPKFIPVNEELPKGMNFPLLKRMAIDFAQDLSGDIWTDFNEHDPGVTILENICYALTELSYKTQFDFEKLLFAESDDSFNPDKN